jgi:hypothetical protein
MQLLQQIADDALSPAAFDFAAIKHFPPALLTLGQSTPLSIDVLLSQRQRISLGGQFGFRQFAFLSELVPALADLPLLQFKI